jgi:hypothetical protein
MFAGQEMEARAGRTQRRLVRLRPAAGAALATLGNTKVPKPCVSPRNTPRFAATSKHGSVVYVIRGFRQRLRRVRPG